MGMVRVGRSAVGLAVMAAGVGCSLLTPLDYVGGSAQQAGGSPTGSAGVGGALGGLGGSGAQGGGGASVGGSGGADAGAMTGVGGSSAEGGAAGEAGEAGEGGVGGSAGMGGVGGVGADGGVGGNAGIGGAAGGGTSGAGGCPGVNLDEDPENCGTCGNVCADTAQCLNGECIGSPCDGLCPTFVTVLEGGDGFRMDNIGTAEQCFEVIGYVRDGIDPTLVCWNFHEDRTLEVNGAAVACVVEPGADVGAPRAGGYCVKAGAGEFSYAGFKFPLP
jgi:hypothetical protein